MVELPCGFTSSVDIKASKPRPKAKPLFDELYFLCTAIYVVLVIHSVVFFCFSKAFIEP